jgi:signal transduction histidine kinase
MSRRASSAAVKIVAGTNPQSSASAGHELVWNRRILIVDDEPAILESYKNLLEPQTQVRSIQSSRVAVAAAPVKSASSTFEIVTASNYGDAVTRVQEALKENKPFVFGFFDVRLGDGKDGVELAQEVRKLDSRMGIIFVTAYNDRSLDSIEGVLGMEVNDQWDFLNKPFNNNEILQKARNFTALWNLKRESEEKSVVLADLNRMVLEGERVNSVAAVARGVTHEFGNLLMQIIGKAEISRAKNETEMREALDRIIDAGTRASEILDRFNNLSDNKSAGTNKSKGSIDLIVKEALDLVGHQLRRESVTVVLNLQSLSGVLVSLHSTSILQVFINLLINAMHALEGRSHKQVTITSEVTADVVRIIFKDNGPGAPAELLDKLTVPFFTTKGARGTGLGLAICREIIEIDHGGEFKVANATQGGFEVTLTMNLKE